MRLRYRDVDGTLLETQPGGTKEVTSNDVTEFTIDLGDYSDPLIYRVDVELQQKLGGVWQTLGTEREYIGSQSKSPDNVLNTAVGQDFGTGPFSGGQPSAPGTLTWDLANDTITPRLTGDLIMVNSQGTRARMRITSYDVHGNELSRFASDTKEPASNAVAEVPDQLGAGPRRPGDLPGGRRDHRRRLRDVDADRRPAADVHHLTRRPNQSPRPRRRRLRPAPPRRVSVSGRSEHVPASVPSAGTSASRFPARSADLLGVAPLRPMAMVLFIGVRPIAVRRTLAEMCRRPNGVPRRFPAAPDSRRFPDMAGAVAGGRSASPVSRSSVTFTLVMGDPVVVAVSPSTGAEMLLVRAALDEDSPTRCRAPGRRGSRRRCRPRPVARRRTRRRR